MLEKAIAKSLSVCFHPIVYPLYGFLLLFFIDNQFVVQLGNQAKIYILGIVFINTLFFPLALTWVFKRRGIISSYRFDNRKERFYPLLSGLLFYVTTWYLINRLPLLPIYSYLLFLASVITLVAIVINFFYKISLHSMGAAAFSMSILGISALFNLQLTLLIGVSFLLTGLIASSRLILKLHNSKQVYLGLVVGFLSSLLSFLIYI